MLRKTKTQKKKMNALNYLSLVILLIGLILGFIEGGIFGSLMTILLWLIGVFGALLGLIPVVGPFIYYEVIGLIFGYLSAPFNLNLAALVVFLFFLGISLIYTMISTLALILLVYLKRKIK